MSRAASDWALFVDWCTANGEQALPASAATVRAFLADVPGCPATLARRTRAIDAAHRALGEAGPGRDALRALVAPAQRYSPRALASALGRTPIGGWPAGLVGRRDAAIVALICAAGFSRADVRRLRLSEAGQSAPRLPTDQEPGSCPRCAYTRWARAAFALSTVGWRALRYELEDIGALLAEMTEHHDCQAPLPRLTGAEGPLFMAIDRTGQPSPAPLSCRSVSAIVSARTAAEDQASRIAAGRTISPPSPAERAATIRRLDELCALMERASEDAAAVCLGMQA
jgi:hypothetical protein